VDLRISRLFLLLVRCDDLLSSARGSKGQAVEICQGLRGASLPHAHRPPAWDFLGMGENAQLSRVPRFALRWHDTTTVVHTARGFENTFEVSMQLSTSFSTWPAPSEQDVIASHAGCHTAGKSTVTDENWAPVSKQRATIKKTAPTPLFLLSSWRLRQRLEIRQLIIQAKYEGQEKPRRSVQQGSAQAVKTDA
jgi:hypothetical protein